MPFSYADYNVISTTYSKYRRPVGFDKELQFFKQNRTKKVQHQMLLDAGCGTGNYAVCYVDYFAHVHCFDYNKGMLKQTKINLAKKFFGGWESKNENTISLSESNEAYGEGQRYKFSKENNGLDYLIDKLKKKQIFVSVEQGNICELPYENQSFDAICNNQVVHHLRPENDFSDIRNAVKEFYRVLRKGGRCVIIWSPPDNHAAFWWNELIPDAFEKVMQLSPTVEKLQEICTATGFGEIVIEPILEEIQYDTQMYMNPANYLDINNFKLIDSSFSLATDEELRDGVAKIKGMIANGTLDIWFKRKEDIRKQTGQAVIIYAVKK